MIRCTLQTILRYKYAYIRQTETRYEVSNMSNTLDSDSLPRYVRQQDRPNMTQTSHAPILPSSPSPNSVWTWTEESGTLFVSLLLPVCLFLSFFSLFVGIC